MSNRTQLVRKQNKIASPLTRKQRATRRLMFQPWPQKRQETNWASVGTGTRASLFTHVMVYDGTGVTKPRRVGRVEWERNNRVDAQ